MCITENIRDELSEEWSADELPDSVVWNVEDEEFFEDAAALKITLWDDLDRQEVTEVIWFLLEDDGWKLSMEPPEEYYEYWDSTLH